MPGTSSLDKKSRPRKDFPEVIEDTLEDGPAVIVRFNHRGTLLAAGCSDGTIVVWDFDTRGVSRSLIGHVKTVTCLSSLFIAALHQEKPVIVDFSNGVKRSPILADPNNNNDNKKHNEATTTTGPTQWILVVTFDKQGKKIYMGSNRGQISIIDTETRSLLHEIRPTTSAIKNIQFSRRGKEIVVNANDRIIRLFETKENSPPEQVHKFQDLVNRIQWNQCCFSSDADYVIGGSAHQAEHNIYIWDKSGGNLVKILEGPKEPLEDIAWHPIRPIVASVSSFGTIHIWATNYQENWSAFAPDFKELEENIDYEEREDEFDIVPEEEASKRKHDDEDVVIDVTSIEKINPFNDSDSEDGEEETFYLPLLPSDHQDEELVHHKHRHHDGHRRNHHSHRSHSGRHHRHNHQGVVGNGNNNGISQSKLDGSQSNNVNAEGLDLAEEERKKEYRDRDHGRDRDGERSHERQRETERDRDQDRDRGGRVRDRDRERDRAEKQHKPKKEKEQRSEEEDFDSDRKHSHSHGHGYQNGSANGNGYDRDHSTGARRRLDDQHSSPRSAKKQR
ncbi:hypothetical protein BGZ58_008737 [Dissophora ornata]|nr:hypothetical protein BGZ58_008737 [Dissophora ornata]